MEANDFEISYPDKGGYTGIWISSIQGRFFVFGRLLRMADYPRDVNALFQNWKPVMDEVIRREKELMKHQRGIHISEIVTPEMEVEISNLMGRVPNERD